MSMYDRITINLTGHGVFGATANGLDRAIVRYISYSPYDLRLKVDAHPANPYPAGRFNSLITVSEYLMVLADFDEREIPS